jgi:hypothetical protein
MAIPKDFNYKDEDDFIQRFLVPLLQRLGFALVVNYHGKREFGKDLVFMEIDRFGHVRYCGLQAKYEQSISLNGIEGLISDCKQAFANPFVHPNTGGQERIEIFYAVNGGSVSDEAKDHYFKSLQCPEGRSVRLFDGKSLLMLDRWATVNRIDAITERLGGLLVDVRYNRSITDHVRRTLENYFCGHSKEIPPSRFRLEACSAYMACPFIAQEKFIGHVEKYWETAFKLNRDNELLCFPFPSDRHMQIVERDLGFLKDLDEQGSTLEIEVLKILWVCGMGSSVASPEIGPLTQAQSGRW